MTADGGVDDARAAGAAFVLEVACALGEALGLLQRRDEEHVEPLEGSPKDLVLEGRWRRQRG